MATANKDTKTNIFKKIGAFFKNLGIRIWTALREMRAELKKVTWPSKQTLINYTLMVIAFIVVMGVIIFVIDSASAFLVKLITR